MVTDDFKILENIFSAIDKGILSRYDAFHYEVEVYEGHISTELSVEQNGVSTTDAPTDMNDTLLYDLVDKLKTGARNRGDNWTSFTLSYTQGEQLKTQFKYPGDQ